jgi:ATP synthase protein I
MSERKPPSSLDDLGVRLETARARNNPRRPDDGGQGSYGAAFQVAIEMVGTLVVSVGLGWVLDDWLATGPVFLVVFFFLGAAAGGLNVYRRAQLMSAQMDDTASMDNDGADDEE